MKFRQHRELLEESMATVVELEPTKEAIANHWNSISSHYINQEDVNVEYYTYDNRIKWDTYIVTITNGGVLGFTNEPII